MSTLKSKLYKLYKAEKLEGLKWIGSTINDFIKILDKKTHDIKNIVKADIKKKYKTSKTIKKYNNYLETLKHKEEQQNINKENINNEKESTTDLKIKSDNNIKTIFKFIYDLPEEIKNKKAFILESYTEGNKQSFYVLNKTTLNRYLESLNKNDNDKEGINILLPTTSNFSDVMLSTYIKENTSLKLRVVTRSTKKLVENVDYFFMDAIEGDGINEILKNGIELNLRRYQITNDLEYFFSYDFSKLNCFCYALYQAGVSYDTVYMMNERLNNITLRRRDIKKIIKETNLYVKITTNGKTHNSVIYKGKLASENQEIIKIGLVNGHYFLNEKTEITIKDLYKYTGEVVKSKKTESFLSSYYVIKYMFKHKNIFFEHIKNKSECKNNLNGVLKPDIKLNRSTHDGDCVLNTEEDIPDDLYFEEDDFFKNIFADFETYTDSNNIHIPYMLRFCDNNILNSYVCLGENCGEVFLNKICCLYGGKIKKQNKTEEIKEIDKNSNKIQVYFHNLNYDINFLYKYLHHKSITYDNNNKVVCCSGFVFFNEKQLKIKIIDSYRIIPMALDKFGCCFNLKVNKEIMPYDYYTEERVKKQFIDMEEFKNYKDYDTFILNCEKWHCIENNKIDIIKYSAVYCGFDCVVCNQGYNAFRKTILNNFNINTDNYVSLSSISDAIIKKNNCYKGVYCYQGAMKDFFMSAIVGGRCMVKNNTKCCCNVPLLDFDAVSLYPSAQVRLNGYVKGKPKILTDKQKNMTFLKSEGITEYVLRIKINKINKKLNFPILSKKNKSGIRNFSNDLEEEVLTIDRVSLEDAIKYQNIDFEIIEGVFFNEGYNTAICDLIKSMFELRKEYKNNNNPLEVVFKLLLNSSYGKTITKDPEYIYSFFDDEKEGIYYLSRNYQHIKEYVKIDNKYGGVGFKFKEYALKEEKPIYAMCGVQVLSMSKRIMNEVFYLDLGDNKLTENYIYYQDTDSMHIEKSKLDEVIKKYEEKYNKKLVGKDLGQFHNDFQLKNSVGVVYSEKSIFLGKKCYIDILHGEDENKNILKGEHIRMKGVNYECIKNHKTYTDTYNMYKALFNGEKLIFDLCDKSKPVFKKNKNMTISTIKEFKRCLCF